MKTQKITMKHRAIPIPYTYRLSYRMTLSCIILYYSVGRTACSITKFQTISNALLVPYAREQFIELLKSKENLIKELRFDPHINSILKYTIAEGLIYYQKTNNFIRLTKKGKKFSEIIIKEKIILREEINFLQEYSRLLKEELDTKIKFIEGQLLME